MPVNFLKICERRTSVEKSLQGKKFHNCLSYTGKSTGNDSKMKIDCCGLGCSNCKILAREAGISIEDMEEMFPSIFDVKLVKVQFVPNKQVAQETLELLKNKG